MAQCRHEAVVGRHPSGASAADAVRFFLYDGGLRATRCMAPRSPADFEGATSSSKLGVLYNEERFFDEIGELYDSYYEFDTHGQETARVEALWPADWSNQRANRTPPRPVRHLVHGPAIAPRCSRLSGRVMISLPSGRRSQAASRRLRDAEWRGKFHAGSPSRADRR